MYFRDEIQKRILVLDGAMGTMLLDHSLPSNMPPEIFNLNNKKLISEIHNKYIEAGADLITTNTFGGSYYKLQEYGLIDDFISINKAGVEIAKGSANGRALVGGSIGPLGKLLKPFGDISSGDARIAFSEQAKVLINSGIDLIILETFFDLKEIKCAIIAIREFSNIPIIAMMTFTENGRTSLGTAPEAFAVTVSGMEIDAIGVNCSLGASGVSEIITRISEYSELPLVYKPNAGIPEMRGGITRYSESPSCTSKPVKSLAEIGVKCFGGCCGTTPSHIKSIKESIEKIKNIDNKRLNPYKDILVLSNRTDVFIAPDRLKIVGEKLNTTGKKKLREELKSGNFSEFTRILEEEIQRGVDLLDINIGFSKETGKRIITEAILIVDKMSSPPILIDSSDVDVIEAGASEYPGKPILNSTTSDNETLDRVINLSKRFGAAFVGLSMECQNLSITSDEKYKEANKIVIEAKRRNVNERDIIIDPIVLPAALYPGSSFETLKTLKKIKSNHKVTTIMGLSNVSHGMPQREPLNRVFLLDAISHGLDYAIVNPDDTILLELIAAKEYLAGKNDNYGKVLLRDNKEEENKDALSGIIYSVVRGSDKGVIDNIKRALAEGYRRDEILNRALIEGIKRVGDEFRKGNFILLNLLASSSAVEKGMAYLEEGASITVRSEKILMATVYGDIHDIGKRIVGSILKSAGFYVVDIGKNIPKEIIVNESITHDVSIVGLSALMTTTMVEMEATVKLLKIKNPKVKIIIGGACISEDFRLEIGADAYGRDAIDALDKIERMAKT